MLFKCRNTGETAALSSWETVGENWYVFHFSEKFINSNYIYNSYLCKRGSIDITKKWINLTYFSFAQLL